MSIQKEKTIPKWEEIAKWEAIRIVCLQLIALSAIVLIILKNTPNDSFLINTPNVFLNVNYLLIFRLILIATVFLSCMSTYIIMKKSLYLKNRMGKNLN